MRPFLSFSLLSRSDLRLASFGFSAVAAVYLGFLGVSVSHAETFIKYAGYYVLLLTFALWVASLCQLARQDPSAPVWPWRERVWSWLAVGLFTGIAVTHETFRSKILNDEFVLQSTAFNMHFFREVSAMARGYDFLGTFLSTDAFLDKRPNFYPFLVSLVHDFTGYRIANAFYLNTALMAVTLRLAYLIGRRWSGWRGGLLAVALLGSLPVFAQNATGSGMEMLNVTMLLAVVWLGALYLELPGKTRLTAFLLATVLLAQCRYESLLYVLPAAFLVLLGWWKVRGIVLSWAATLVPLLLVPAALHNRVLAHSPALWEMKQNQNSRFALEYLTGNLRGARDFFLAFNQYQANSVLLTLIGAAGLGWVVVALVVRRKHFMEMDAMRLAWVFFGLGIVANTVLVMFYYWASFSDPMASRFSLPFYVLLVFVAVLFAAWLDRRRPVMVVLLALTFLCFLGSSIPKQSRHQYSRVGIDEIEWERRYVASRPPGERIILTNSSTIIWLLQKTPSILLSRARLVPDRLHYQLGQSNFSEILVLQALRPTTMEGDYDIVLDDRLPDTFQLEMLAEKRFATKLVRISKLVAVNLPAVAESVAAQSTTQ